MKSNATLKEIVAWLRKRDRNKEQLSITSITLSKESRVVKDSYDRREMYIQHVYGRGYHTADPRCGYSCGDGKLMLRATSISHYDKLRISNNGRSVVLWRLGTDPQGEHFEQAITFSMKKIQEMRKELAS